MSIGETINVIKHYDRELDDYTLDFPSPAISTLTLELKFKKSKK